MGHLDERKELVSLVELLSYEMGVSPLWDAYKSAFENMFKEPLSKGFIDGSETTLLNDTKNNVNWEWYVKDRATHNDLETFYYEKKLNKILFQDNDKRLIYLIGHTGIGKTTLMLYFFNHYIKETLTKEQLEKLVVVRIPFIFKDVQNVRSTWNLRVNDFLFKTFNELKSETFIKNVARMILYPPQDWQKVIPNGLEDETKIPSEELAFFHDTEKRIENTYKGSDKISVIEWFKKSLIHIDTEKNRENYLKGEFNKYAIKVLSEIYGYKFIFIVDNTDQLPIAIQSKIWRIVYTKLSSYQPNKNIKFLISVRASAFEKAKSETFSSSYIHLVEWVSLLPLPYKKVLQNRKKVFFDKYRNENTGKLRLSESFKVSTEYIDEFFDNIFERFDNLRKMRELHSLSNYNIRRILSIVRSIFLSPHLSYEDLADIGIATSKDYRQVRYDVSKKFVGYHRILDSIIRGTNRLVSDSIGAQLPNIYNSNNINRFYSTLNKVFILRIISTRKVIGYIDLKNILSSFGHPKEITKSSIQDLLEYNLLYSNQGSTLLEGDDLMHQYFETKKLPYAKYFLNKVAPKLLYLQAVAYVTPLEKKFRKRLTTPPIDDDIEFYDKVKNASALYSQLKSDFKSQITYIQQLNNNEQIMRTFNYYRFWDLISNIRRTIIKDIENIKYNAENNQQNCNKFKSAFCERFELFPR